VKVAAAAAWRDERTLEMQWRFYELAHRYIVTCRFGTDWVEMDILSSMTGEILWRLTGRAMA
jgi:hypothetical protein